MRPSSAFHPRLVVSVLIAAALLGLLVLAVSAALLDVPPGTSVTPAVRQQPITASAQTLSLARRAIHRLRVVLHGVRSRTHAPLNPDRSRDVPPARYTMGTGRGLLTLAAPL